jgi:hypothetical protein
MGCVASFFNEHPPVELEMGLIIKLQEARFPPSSSEFLSKLLMVSALNLKGFKLI